MGGGGVVFDTNVDVEGNEKVGGEGEVSDGDVIFDTAAVKQARCAQVVNLEDVWDVD